LSATVAIMIGDEPVEPIWWETNQMAARGQCVVTYRANVATLRPRHLPLAVTLRNPEVDGLATTRPAVVREAWRKAAAEELLRAREEALSHMRRAGVLVLDVLPDRAAEAVVDKYLELKRRGRL
jgi:uncharacterized protein (DUF58 family)